MSSELILNAGSLLTVLLNRCSPNVNISDDSGTSKSQLCFLCNFPSNSYESKLFGNIQNRIPEAEILRSMKLSRANSLCELFRLESLPSTLKKRLLNVHYCASCFGLISEVDYFIKLAGICTKKLEGFKGDVERLLISAATGAEPPGAKRVKIESTEAGPKARSFGGTNRKPKIGPKCSRLGSRINYDLEYCDEVAAPEEWDTREASTNKRKSAQRQNEILSNLNTNKLVDSLTTLQASFERTEKELRSSNQRLQRLEAELVTVKGKLDTHSDGRQQVVEILDNSYIPEDFYEQSTHTSTSSTIAPSHSVQEKTFVSVQVDDKTLELKLPDSAISTLIGITKERSAVLFLLRHFYTISFLRNCNLTGVGKRREGSETIKYSRQAFPGDMILLISEAISKLFPPFQNPETFLGQLLLKQQHTRTKKQISSCLQYFRDQYNDDGTMIVKIKSRSNNKTSSSQIEDDYEDEEVEDDSN